MRNKLSILFALIFAITCIFVSCADIGNDNSKDLVSISLSSKNTNPMYSGKAVRTSSTAYSGTIYWTYTAESKTGNGVGEVKTETALGTPETPSEKLNLSKGIWVFKVWGYATKNGDTYSDAVYYGEKEVVISSTTTSVVVSYSKQSSILDKTLKKATVTLANTFSIAGSSKNITNTDIKYKITTGNTVGEATSYTKAFELTPGENTIELSYTDSSSSDVYSGIITFTAYAGYSYELKESLNLDGRLVPHYEVEFSSNYQTMGKTDSSENVTSTGIRAKTQKVIAPDAPEVSKDGCKFVGWNAEEDGSGTITYAPGSAIPVTANATYYAIWIDKNTPNKIVTFSTNHNASNHPDIKTVAVSAGTTVTTPVAPTDDSAYGGFLGWNTQTNGKGTTTYAAGTAITVTADTVLYAKWSKGVADVLKSAGMPNNECAWVQLWANGPKFATVNVGARIDNYENVTTYETKNIGGYYQWGGTTDKDKSDNYYSQYKDIDSTESIGSTAGDLGDTARILWGENWKMPAYSDLTILKKSNKTSCAICTSNYETSCTIVGYKITGKNSYSSNSLFMPAAGLYTNDGAEYDDGPGSYSVGENGLYWSNSWGEEEGLDDAKYLNFGINTTDPEHRRNGYSVRAILAE